MRVNPAYAISSRAPSAARTPLRDRRSIAEAPRPTCGRRAAAPAATTLAPMPEQYQVVVFVEIPAGSRNKYEFDDELGGIVLDRRLFTSMSYPADYGFIDGTLGEGGDPLDALVLVGDPTFPGCRIRARAVGVFHMTDEKGPDEKVICVPLKDPAWMRVADV